MELLKVLAMPFQAASLMFVAASSLLLAWTTSLGGVWLVLGVLQYWLMLLWLVNYSLRLVDDAANGVREVAVASYEMMADPLHDLRGMVHPILAGAAFLMHYLRPEWPVAPTLIIAALLFPASIAACAMSGHARDALNPAAIWGVLRGFGAWYLALVLLVAGCVLAALLLVRATAFNAIGSRAVMFFGVQMLVLVAYAGIGGALYIRRRELDFEPRISPERKEEQRQNERARELQSFLDGLYGELRARQTPRATRRAGEWLGSLPPAQLATDLNALFAAGREWREPREYPRLLRGLLPVLLGLRQPALAMRAADAALAANPAFAPGEEPTAVALVGYALQTGRRRAAVQMLENYLKENEARQAPGAELLALRTRLQTGAGAQS